MEVRTAAGFDHGSARCGKALDARACDQSAWLDVLERTPAHSIALDGGGSSSNEDRDRPSLGGYRDGAREATAR